MRTLEKNIGKHRQAFADFVYEWRQEEHLTQEELAELCGIDRKTINRIENGHFSPSLDTMVRLAHAFKVPFATIAIQVTKAVN